MWDATPLLRLYARRRLAQLAHSDPTEAQHRTLTALVRHAAGTRFGREHGFAALRTVADYQRAVPLRRYEDFWTEYWQAPFPRLVDVTWPGLIPRFAASSGTTTGVTKQIPVSLAMSRANRHAVFDLLSHHVAHRPESRVLGGKSFMLGGSSKLKPLAPGVAAGDLSGIAASEVPWWARGRYFPPPDLARIEDWEEKVARVAARSLQEDIRTFGGTPSWLLLFVEQLAALRPGAGGRLAGHYPNLELLVHGGVNFAPYRARFEALVQGGSAELREVYPASEGFVAVADRAPGQGLRLLLDNGLFFEFVPVGELDRPAPTRHWVGNAEPGVDYALVVTSCAGLWAYILGDTVRLVDRRPPRVFVTGRTSYGLSAFGEHLIGEEIEEAVAAAAADVGRLVVDFTVTPIYPAAEGGPGRHLFLVEFTPPADAEALRRFSITLDMALLARNADYAAHRSGDFGLLAPLVEPIPAGGFARWMKARGKLGGQNKVPRVIAEAELLASLREQG
ncbi:hypothetical protein GCM10011611_52410 [Aliidongia dinghuensis]|uniref:GH3 auxin-responsive promoter n=1 Tax=Aliidongia dinghuensis TaxID=1867774 RepID=A0A8J2YZX0_9PROT|nr:GH3 auxin-responsive promoter family protein [Aliidongia dinghuensis]GGF39514.1 hypothetical protein GCM10011611_52410 [Aliidongia dinghuensis]